MIFDLARFFLYHIVPQAGGDTQKVEIHVTLKPSETTLFPVAQLSIHTRFFYRSEVLRSKGQ